MAVHAIIPGLKLETFEMIFREEADVCEKNNESENYFMDAQAFGNVERGSETVVGLEKDSFNNSLVAIEGVADLFTTGEEAKEEELEEPKGHTITKDHPDDVCVLTETNDGFVHVNFQSQQQDTQEEMESDGFILISESQLDSKSEEEMDDLVSNENCNKTKVKAERTSFMSFEEKIQGEKLNTFEIVSPTDKTKLMDQDFEMDFLSYNDWPELGMAQNDRVSKIRAKFPVVKKMPKRRKLKKLPLNELGFYSVFSIGSLSSSPSENDEWDMELEYEMFEQELLHMNKDSSNIENETKVDSNLNNEKCNLDQNVESVTEHAIENKTVNEEKSSKSQFVQKPKIKERKAKLVDRNLHLEEDLIPCPEQEIIESLPKTILKYLPFEGSQYLDVRLRRKNKWRHQKARKACKSKQCKYANIINRKHGEKIYISARRYIPISYRNMGYSYSYNRPHTFVPGFKTVKELKEFTKGSPMNRYNGPLNNGPKFPLRGQNPPRPAYALNVNNVDQDIDQDIINVLINLQDRDLTPEDYELLLRLDERVKPKTLSQEALESFKSDIVTQQMVENQLEICSVCMDPYMVGESRKHLPCGHIFHAECIEQWLTNSSMNCPLDGISLERS